MKQEVTYNGLTFEPYISKKSINFAFKFILSKNPMKTITLKDKTFGISIPEGQLFAAIDKVADKMNADLNGKNPLFIIVLNGAFMFASDLFRAVDMDAEISFIRLQSYQGVGSTGVVKEVIGLTENIEGRTVIVVEDIVDTGVTMAKLVKDLEAKNPASVKVATMLYKPDSVQCDLKLDYVGFPIPSKFIVGYGLDLDGLARNLPDIYSLKQDK